MALIAAEKAGTVKGEPLPESMISDIRKDVEVMTDLVAEEYLSKKGTGAIWLTKNLKDPEWLMALQDRAWEIQRSRGAAPSPARGQGEVRISGQCTDGSCHLKVEATDKTAETVASLKGLPATVDRVLKEHSTKGQSHPAPAPSLNKTPTLLDAPAPPEGHSKKTIVCRSSLKHAHSLK